MKIKRLHLENYRGFVDRSFEFHPEFTLLIGENGSGKSAVLSACASAFFEGGSIKANPPRVTADDTRIQRVVHQNEVRFELLVPLIVEAEVDFLGNTLTYDCRQNDGWIGVFSQARQQLQDAALLPAVPLPLPLYYRADRLSQTSAKGMDSGPDRSKLSRLAAYENCLDGTLAVAKSIEWLRREQFIALQEGTESLGFAAAQEAMRRCLPGCTDIHYSVKEEALIVGFHDGTWRTFDSLSDGQKIILAMVADIATRAAWLNPGLGESVLQETPGVVLIDELDLHLHPRWQRHVVGDLRRTFPKFQFIASTHSPFIIQSMKPGEVLNLDEKPGGEARSEYWNSGIEEIAEEEMGVEDAQRSERYGRMLEAAEEYFRAALTPGADDPKEIDEKLRRVLREFPDDPALEARLKLEAIAAKAGLPADPR